MSKTVEQIKEVLLRLRSDRNGDDFHSGQQFMIETVLDIINNPSTTPSPDVAGSDAVAILRELVSLKRLKDTVGKTDEYIQRQPKAWLEAERIVSIPQHPKPAGASVGIEEAADSYARDTYDNFPYAVVAMDSFNAGAAFQAAQGHGNRPTGPAVEVASEDELFRLIELNRDSAITLNKMIEDLSKHVAPATGIPDVRELVEALEEVLHVCGAVNFSSHNQMRNAIEVAVSAADTALASHKATL